MATGVQRGRKCKGKDDAKMNAPETSKKKRCTDKAMNKKDCADLNVSSQDF